MRYCDSNGSIACTISQQQWRHHRPEVRVPPAAK
jgi:hypothetical protein